VQAVGTVALHERLDVARARERGEVAARRRVVAQRVHEPVDLADRRSGDVLDRLDRPLRALAIGLVQQARRAGLDQDHVHGVPGRVVQLARDAGALLGRGKAALARGLPLGALGPLGQLRDPLTPLARHVADDPGAGPGDRPEGDPRIGVDHGRDGPQRGEDGARGDTADARGALVPGMRRERVDRQCRPQPQLARVAERVDADHRRRGRPEDRERIAPPPDERQVHQCEQRDPDGVAVAHVGLRRPEAVQVHDGDRRNEGRQRDRDVELQLTPHRKAR
jgi:hypothetical protein